MNYIQMLDQIDELERQNEALRASLREVEGKELAAFKETVEQKTERDAVGGYNTALRRAARMALDHLNRIGEKKSPARHELETVLYRTPKYLQQRRDAKMAIYALRDQKKQVARLIDKTNSDEHVEALRMVMVQLDIALQRQSTIRAQFIPVLESNVQIKKRRVDARRAKKGSSCSQ